MADRTLSTYLYTDDSGLQWNIVLNADDAAAVGAEPATDSNAPYLRRSGRQKPRMVHGVTPNGVNRKSIVCPTQAILMDKWATGFTAGGISYLATGREGERFSLIQSAPE